MSEFRFRKFTVSNRRSAMKVNTDGVLLGASMTLRETDKTLLDIGTGTGTIALMAAQRLFALNENMMGEVFMMDEARPFMIYAIDIDHDSAQEAAENFAASPWASMLEARDASLEAFDASLGEAVGFDMIFSNPPYFDSSLQAQGARRNDARHTMSLSFREILEFASRRLSACGRLSMILPSDLERSLLREARSRGLYAFRILRIRTVERKAPSRMVVEFARKEALFSVLGENQTAVEENLTLLEGGSFTADYAALTSDFYL